MDQFLKQIDWLDRTLMQEQQLISAIRSVARKIRRESVADYKSKWPKASSRKHGDPIVSGLTDRIKKYKKTGHKYVFMSTFGNRKKGSRSYFLSFFEGGTEERKKGNRSYGRIEPLGSFTDSLKQNESVFEDAVHDAIEKILQKAKNKK